MPAYSVAVVTRDQHGQEFIDQSTVVYASTDGAARTLGAASLGVSEARLTVTPLGGTGGNMNIIGRQTDDGVEILNPPTQ